MTHTKIYFDDMFEQHEIDDVVEIVAESLTTCDETTTFREIVENAHDDSFVEFDNLTIDFRMSTNAHIDAILNDDKFNVMSFVANDAFEIDVVARVKSNDDTHIAILFAIYCDDESLIDMKFDDVLKRTIVDVMFNLSMRDDCENFMLTIARVDYDDLPAKSISSFNDEQKTAFNFANLKMTRNEYNDAIVNASRVLCKRHCQYFHYETQYQSQTCLFSCDDERVMITIDDVKRELTTNERVEFHDTIRINNRDFVVVDFINNTHVDDEQTTIRIIENDTHEHAIERRVNSLYENQTTLFSQMFDLIDEIVDTKTRQSLMSKMSNVESQFETTFNEIIDELQS